MITYNWNESARGLAGFVQKFRFLVERGVVPLQVEREPSGKGSNDEALLFGVFGNDEGGAQHREADAVRQHLHDEQQDQE